MMISSKGRYALRAMIDLAEQQKTEYIPLKEIAERQNISQKYLESIMTILSKSNYIDALQGKGGGYRLNRSPKEYRVGDIFRVVQEDIVKILDGLEDCKRDCLLKPSSLKKGYVEELRFFRMN